MIEIKGLHKFHFAINAEENKIKVWDEVTGKTYNDSAGRKTIGDLLGFIAGNKPVAQDYYTEVYKMIEVEE